jgi:hypothetical protein
VAGELKVGDCMPQALSPGEVPVDRFSRYNGLAYFISTSNTSIGNLPYNTDFASKFSSIAIYSTFIDNGSLFATNVPFGEYYIMLSSVPNFMDSKVNVESSNSVVSRDIKYCASY